MPTPIEIEFIRMWRACAVDGYADYKVVNEWIQNIGLGCIPGMDYFVNPISRTNGLRGWDWTLNPCGADLIATADAIGFDPDAVEDSAEPEVPECSECGGSGRVAVIGSFANPCRACNSVEHWAAKVGRQIAADLEAMWVKPSRLSSDDFDEQPVGFTFKSPIQRLKEIADRVPTFSTGALTKREARPVSFTFGGVPPATQVQSQPVAAKRLPDSKEFVTDIHGVRIVHFGKHFGKELKDVPDEYLAWMDGSFFFGEGTQAILTREVLSRRIDAALKQELGGPVRIAPPVVSSVLNSHRKQAGSLPNDPGTSAPDLPDSIACPNPRGIDPNPPGADED